MITKLEAWCYKSLKHFSISPSNVNLIIGANGTGKTNFVDLIDFISAALRLGLKEAFDKQGGIDEVRTKPPGSGRRPALACEISLGPDPNRGIKEATYYFRVAASKSLEVEEERLEAIVLARSPGRRSLQELVKYSKTTEVRIKFSRKKEKITEWSSLLGENPKSADDPQNLILNIYGKLGHFRNISDYLSSMRVYNIDGPIAKISSDLTDNELERSGANMISFLKKVLEDDHLRSQLLDDLRNAVPYIKNIVPQRILTYTTLRFEEADSKLDFTAQQMSDGTIRLLGMLAILRQSVPPTIAVIEEPENAIHSHAVKVFCQIAQEVSNSPKLSTQIFLTSHSPTVVDSILSLDSQLDTSTKCFVAKRKKGVATIEQVSEKVMRAIARNLGRPSDFLREGSFGDTPSQLEIEFDTNES